MKRPPKAEVERLLGQHDGSISGLSRSLGIPRGVVQRWCTDYDLRGRGKGGQTSTAPPEEELRAVYERCGGSVARMVEAMGAPRSTVRAWLRSLGLEAKGALRHESIYPQVLHEDLADGFVVCFSDAHLWFEEKSRAHEALLVVLRKLKPAIVVANGDVLDGARISRHDPSGVDPLPTLADELHVSKMHMAEIARASGGAKRYFTLGNHDSRLSRYLANHAPEMEDVDGSRLDHHILGWEFCVSLTINTDVVVKHAWRGGTHATRNNTLNDGRTIVCGHLHSQKVAPLTDARGTRYGVDLGCLADPDWPQFNYTIANTKDWRSGFGVLEFRGGRLLPPMLASVLDDRSVYLQRNERVI